MSFAGFRPGRGPRPWASGALLVVCLTAAGDGAAASLAGTAGDKTKGKGSAAGQTAKARTTAKASKGKATRVAEGRKAKPQATAKASNWLFQTPANVVPNQQGKVVVFTFQNDDRDAMSAHVGRLLEARGLEVMTGVRPVDSAEQYRDVATHLGLAAFVDGDVRGTDDKTRVTVRLRSGFTGRHVSKVVFTESRENLAHEMTDTLWKKVGPVVARACVDAGKPRRPSRTTLQINAGTPIETIPNPPR